MRKILSVDLDVTAREKYFAITNAIIPQDIFDVIEKLELIKSPFYNEKQVFSYGYFEYYQKTNSMDENLLEEIYEDVKKFIEQGRYVFVGKENKNNIELIYGYQNDQIFWAKEYFEKDLYRLKVGESLYVDWINAPKHWEQEDEDMCVVLWT